VTPAISESRTTPIKNRTVHGVKFNTPSSKGTQEIGESVKKSPMNNKSLRQSAMSPNSRNSAKYPTSPIIAHINDLKREKKE
jgi:hypothetical protein